MMKIEKRMKTAGIIACISAIVFALPHFWFALGISLAFPGDFSTLNYSDGGELITLLGVGGLSILVAIYAIAFTHSANLRNRLPELIIALPAWIGSVGLTLWGLGFFNLQLMFAMNRVQSTPQFAISDASPNAIWGYYWYSLFIVWGLSLGFAAYYSYRLRKLQKSTANDDSDV